MTTPSLLLMAAAGAVLSLALPPSGFWPLLLALSPLFWLVASSDSPARAFRLGFAFGLGFFTLYILWLPASFASPEFFGSYFWLLYPPLLLLLASMWGLVTWAARWLGGGGGTTLALLPPFWVLMEWARTQGYFAFPWGTLGYAWLDTPVAQLADTVGLWGLSLLAASSAALLAVPFNPGRMGAARLRFLSPLAVRPGTNVGRRLLAPLAALAVISAAWLAGDIRLQREYPQPDLTALLVQGNVDPFGRLSGATSEVETQAELTRSGARQLAAPPDLVVWPEGAVLAGLEGPRGERALEVVQASAPESAFLVGARVNSGRVSYNSAYTVEDGKLLDRYDKFYLVPFGERFPFVESAAPLYRAVFGMFGLSMLASTSAGTGLKPLASPLGPLAAYICYESVFPQVQRSMVSQGARLLVNITNDAWFSRGDGAQQHYEMGRMRAIETRRYLLRAGNDGITGVVDPRGQTLAQLPRDRAAVMTAPFALLDGVTPWVRYGGLLVPLLLFWVVLVSAVRFVSARSTDRRFTAH